MKPWLGLSFTSLRTSQLIPHSLGTRMFATACSNLGYHGAPIRVLLVLACKDW
jgi:hypothetical protein